MSNQIDKNDALLIWLSRWYSLIALDEGEYDAAEEVKNKTFDEFKKYPTEAAFQRLLDDLSYRSQNANIFKYKKDDYTLNTSVVLEDIIQYLWFRYRANKLGILDQSPPEIYYSFDTHDRKNLVLMAPAPADFVWHDYLSADTESIFNLFIDDPDRGIAAERFAVLFSFASPETRSVIMPKLLSLFEENEIEPLYIRITPKSGAILSVEPTFGTDLLPIDHVDMSVHEFNDAQNNSFFAMPSKKLLILDFLDYFDWLHTGPNRWLPTYEPLIKTIKEYLEQEDSKILFVLNGNPLSYQKEWLSFLPFFNALGIDQQNISAVGLIPKLMSSEQVRDFMDLSDSDVELLSRRIPFLFSIVLEMKRHLSRMGTLTLPDAFIRQILKTVPDVPVITATSNHVFAPASDSDMELVSSAMRPSNNRKHFVVTTSDGSILSSTELNYSDLQTMAMACEIFEASKILQDIRHNSTCTKQIIKKLIRLKEDIIKEIQREFPNQEWVLNTTMKDLFLAIMTSGEFKNDGLIKFKQFLDMNEIVGRSHTLQNIPNGIVNNEKSLMCFLLTYRDRIAVENLRAQGMLENDEFLFENAHDYFPLPILLNALNNYGAISISRYLSLTSTAVSPLNYFFEHYDRIVNEVKRLGQMSKYDKSDVDISLFYNSKNGNETLSYRYIRRIVTWGNWFLNDPDVAIRSIYRADELAFMALSGGTAVFDRAGDGLALRIEKAGLAAQTSPAQSRKEVVEVLQETIDQYRLLERFSPHPDPQIENELSHLEKLLNWNKDALDYAGGDEGTNTQNTPISNSHNPVSELQHTVFESQQASYLPYTSTSAFFYSNIPSFNAIHTGNIAFQNSARLALHLIC